MSSKNLPVNFVIIATMRTTILTLAAISALPMITAQTVTGTIDDNNDIAQMSESMAQISSTMEMMKTTDPAPTSTMSIAMGIVSSMDALISSMNKMPKATPGSEISAEMRNLTTSMLAIMTSSAEMMGGMTGTRRHDSSMTTMRSGKGDDQTTSTSDISTTTADPTSGLQGSVVSSTISTQNHTSSAGKLPIPGLFRVVNQALGYNGRA